MKMTYTAPLGTLQVQRHQKSKQLVSICVFLLKKCIKNMTAAHISDSHSATWDPKHVQLRKTSKEQHKTNNFYHKPSRLQRLTLNYRRDTTFTRVYTSSNL